MYRLRLHTFAMWLGMLHTVVQITKDVQITNEDILRTKWQMPTLQHGRPPLACPPLPAAVAWATPRFLPHAFFGARARLAGAWTAGLRARAAGFRAREAGVPAREAGVWAGEAGVRAGEAGLRAREAGVLGRDARDRARMLAICIVCARQNTIPRLISTSFKAVKCYGY